MFCTSSILITVHMKLYNSSNAFFNLSHVCISECIIYLYNASLVYVHVLWGITKQNLASSRLHLLQRVSNGIPKSEVCVMTTLTLEEI